MPRPVLKRPVFAFAREPGRAARHWKFFAVGLDWFQSGLRRKRFGISDQQIQPPLQGQFQDIFVKPFWFLFRFARRPFCNQLKILKSKSRWISWRLVVRKRRPSLTANVAFTAMHLVRCLRHFCWLLPPYVPRIVYFQLFFLRSPSLVPPYSSKQEKQFWLMVLCVALSTGIAHSAHRTR